MISVIIPVFNEEKVVDSTIPAVWTVLNSIQQEYELIVVDDGSSDSTLKKIKYLASKNSSLRYISLGRNFGHQVATFAGLDFAKGSSIVIMDGDGQDPPELIPDLLAKLNEGFDVVSAKRTNRPGEGFFKKFTAKLFYRIFKRITNIDMPLDTGDFRIFNSKVLGYLKNMNEKEKFLRGQIAWMGLKQTQLEYERHERRDGDTGYTKSKMFRFAMDGITSFSNWPLRVATISGFICSFIGLLLIIYTLYSRYIIEVYQPGWASLMITVIFIGGIQLIGIGIIGEYISRINNNVKDRPLYIVGETNIEDA